MDTVTKEKRSEIMRSIKGKNTRPEKRLRAALASNRLAGFRMHRADLPGKPDFVYVFSRLAIFVEGCFWHGCPLHYKVPKSNGRFWRGKIKGNILRDIDNENKLHAMGWSTLRFWECQVNTKMPTLIEMVRKAITHD